MSSNIPDRLYVDVISIITHKTYNLKNVPLSYLGKVNPVVTDGMGYIIDPIYEPEPNETCSWCGTIPVIVDMYNSEVSFSFEHTDDMEDIFKYLSVYINYMNTQKPPPPDHILFIKRAMPFLAFLKRRCDNIRAAKQQNGLVMPTFSESLFGTIDKINQAVIETEYQI